VICKIKVTIPCLILKLLPFVHFYFLTFVRDITQKLQEISTRSSFSVSKTCSGSITQFNRLFFLFLNVLLHAPFDAMPLWTLFKKTNDIWPVQTVIYQLSVFLFESSEKTVQLYINTVFKSYMEVYRVYWVRKISKPCDNEMFKICNYIREINVALEYLIYSSINYIQKCVFFCVYIYTHVYDIQHWKWSYEDTLVLHSLISVDI
jgi:hypothetical protein